MFHIPQRLKSFLLKFLLGLLLLTFFRFIFFAFNHSYFSSPGIAVFLGGLRFDLSTLGFLLLPLFALHLLFFIPWKNRIYQALISLFFFLPMLFITVLSSIDLEYFKFTFKRSSSDLFNLLFLSSDVQDQTAQILLDFWYIILVAALAFGALILLYKKTALPHRKAGWQAWLLWTPLLFAFMLVAARGGIQLKPVDVIHAGKYSSAQNIPLVLNTPFTFMKSIGKENLQPVHYFPEEKLEKIYSPVLHFVEGEPSKKLNVVILILESFSSEYIGFLNDYPGYTPFLDSLMRESLVFTNAYANGKKSIESLPAILSGIPSLSQNPYISSNYSGNQISSLPKSLEKHGYNSSFYHGGANGTMGFDAFANMAGIEKYYGLNQYANKEKDYDGNWGIFDEPYLQYFNEELSQKEQPFFAGVFTLSSHHPYTIPAKYEGKFPKGSLKIHESIGYADYALKLFFDAAKKEDYYKNTLFILVADHTAQTDQAEYQNRPGMFRIPVVFHYNRQLIGVNDAVAQQSDIFPSIIDFLNLPADFVCFGNSLFRDNSDHFAINYINGLYQMIQKDYSFLYDGEEAVELINYKRPIAEQQNILQQKTEIAGKMERKLKAVIQQYNRRVINNQLTAE